MIVSQTPLRVSFVGGGTDIPSFYRLHEGCVLSTAINKYIYVILKKRYDSKLVITHYSQESVLSLDDIRHDLIRECLKLMGIKCGMDIIILSDVSMNGTGLGTSSALVVGMINALQAYLKLQYEKGKIAQMACEVEINILGHPIGKQDQYASAYGGMNLIRFCTNDQVIIEKVQLSHQEITELFKHLFLVNVPILRNANEILAKQADNLDKNIDRLKELALIPHDLKEHIESKKFDMLGSYLHKAWIIKRKLTDSISNSTVDEILQNGIDAGALGGKLLGAGQGGFILFYVPQEPKEDFINKMVPLYQFLPIAYEPDGSKIILKIEEV